MSTGIKWLLGIVLLALLVGAWGMSAYNGLVNARETVHGRFADVQAQYQRRFDLVPNMVEAVRGSARFEQTTLQAVVAARSAWATAQASGNPQAQIQAAQSFDTALSRLLVTVEAYPDIKSTQAFRDLMTTLEGTENRVAVARRDYNAAVQAYNASIKRAPTNLVASFGGFDEEPFFQAASGADQAPKIDLNLNP